MISNISMLYFTLKHLRFEQIFYRLFYKFKKVSVLHVCAKVSTKKWQWGGPRIYKQSLFENNKVRYLSVDGSIDSVSCWNCNSKEKLWLYNLHYFDDFNSSSFGERIELQASFLNRWIAGNPPSFGNGWEPYPLSLRLVNLIKWLSCQSIVEQHWLDSLMQQVSALAQQVEYHILGNHLFANAKALTFVGCYIDSEDVDQYLDLGLKLLDREIPEQFLADGAHFELSPMYHCIILWDLLELIDLAETSQNPKLLTRLDKWKSVAEKSLSWLKTMTHPDGEVSFFNDSAIGIAAKPNQIFSYAEKLKLDWNRELDIFSKNIESGYSRLSYSNYSLIFDHANVGPDYLPGHAHADSLSFEMSIGLQRVFVNSGTSLYGTSKERLRQRQTAAHNTVEVCGLSSSQVWSGFRVAKRAYAKLERSKSDSLKIEIVASHDGYIQQGLETRHTRGLECTANAVIINDTLSKAVIACFHLHFHPDVNVIKVSEKEISVVKNGEILCLISSSEPVIVKQSTWHPEFGKSIANKKIEIEFANGHLRTEIKQIKRHS
ncbi:heparinase II/III family protein [Shewanella algae]|uniref:heparinase II/III family protein n=1 Tax=Shewanella algae TaxID=38313 RepID=UPI0034D6239A